MMNLADFVTFYHDYSRRHPTASLKNAVFKYVAGHFCRAESLFGLKLHVNAPALETHKEVSFNEICQGKCSRFRGVDGKIYYYSLTCPSDESASIAMLEDLISFAEEREQRASFQLFENEPFLRDAPDGVYTYMVVSIDDRPFVFAVQTNSVGEVGTKHRHLLHRIIARFPDPNEREHLMFHYAGEIRILSTADHARLIQFNFESGTFMGEEGLGLGRRDDEELYAQQLITLFTRLASESDEAPVQPMKKTLTEKAADERDSKTLRFEHVQEGFIHLHSVTTPHHVIILYILAGLRITVFEGRNCINFAHILLNQLVRRNARKALLTRLGKYKAIVDEYDSLDPTTRPATFDEYFHIKEIMPHYRDDHDYGFYDADRLEKEMQLRTLRIDDPRILVSCSAPPVAAASESTASAGAGGAAQPSRK